MRISSITVLLLAIHAGAAEKAKSSFVNDVVPIFTMSGCANANCHGSIRGQNGFKLSLFGYEPKLDYDAIAAGGVTRINLRQPEESLILRKPTTQIAHGGGFRFAVDSLQYRTILEWIKDGAPYDPPGVARMESLSVSPEEKILIGANAELQLRATAGYSDGSARDVTSMVQYSSNNPDVVQVSAAGKVKALQPGETAVMVRTLGKAVAARILVAASAPGKAYPRAPRHNYIDEHVFSKLERLNIAPSPLASDEEFLRRVCLDTIGLLPTEQEARDFLASTDRGKRVQMIDRLLARREFSELWALKFAELFRAGTREAGAKGGKIVYDWLRRSLMANKPYDRIATELLLSQGSHLFGKGPSSFYNISFDSNAPDHAVNISQVFLGVRIECAKCHNHPWEKWTQDDFYGFAAFFARLGIKEVYENDENATLYMVDGKLTHPKTKQVVDPKYLDGDIVKDDEERDMREDLARWMTSPKNPFFARAFVNRVWKHFLGRGLVEEVDDFRVTNPPTNPALLDAMAADFAGHGCDFRRLVRQILNSRTYQLSSAPNESNKNDAANYSRYFMRRLMAEAMVDAVSEITGVPEKFAGYPPGTRAMQVSSGSSYMLSTFGRLNRDIICERDQQPDMVQTMHLISGDTLHRKIVAPNSIAEQWLKDSSLTDEQILDKLWLRSLARLPRPDEKQKMLSAMAAGRKAALQDALWAILNSKEFLYNH